MNTYSNDDMAVDPFDAVNVEDFAAVGVEAVTPAGVEVNVDAGEAVTPAAQTVPVTDATTVMAPVESGSVTPVQPVSGTSFQPVMPAPDTEISTGGDMVPVQPLPPRPAFASSFVGEPVVGQGFSAEPATASGSTETAVDDETATLTAVTASTTGLSANQLATLETLKLDQYIPNDLANGPTLVDNSVSQAEQDAADFVVGRQDVGLKDYRWKGGIYDDVKIMMTSKGIYQVGADETDINLINNVDVHKWYSGTNGGTYNTRYLVNTAVDASDAEGVVTFHGIDKGKWTDAYSGSTGSDGLPTGDIYHSLTYKYANVFKGGDYGNIVYGGSYADTLIGGQSGDEIYGVGGDNLIYGVAGDNYIDGGDGGSIIFSGTDNDFIRTGKGENTVVLTGGDNWVVVEQNNLDGSSDPNTLVSGSGSDTFVIGNIPPAETTRSSTMDEWAGGLAVDASLDVGKDLLGIGLDAVGYANPLLGVMTTVGFDVISALVGGKPADVVTTTEYTVYEATVVYNFNPLTDRLLLPMNADGAANLSVREVTDDGRSEYDLEIYDHNTGSVLTYINLASKEEIFGSSGELSTTERAAFADSIKSGLFILDADGVQYGGQNIDTTTGFDELPDLGAGRYMFGGAWNGVQMFGNSSNDKYFGSQHDDVLFGFDVFDEDKASDTAIGQKFYGFSGDNFYAPGAGKNRVFGGDGYDTVTYEYSDDGISVDMTELHYDANNPNRGAFVKVYNGYDSDFDRLWSVEGIVGTTYGDEIIGNDDDNTFYSTGGENTWTGTGGSNTFHMTGGSSIITDYSADSDTIVVHKSAYTKAKNLEWVEADDAWTLYDISGKEREAVVVLENSDNDIDAPPDVTMLRNNGTTRDYTPEISTSETSSTFTLDLVA